MRLFIDPRIFDGFPGVRVGVVFARGVDNGGGAPEIRFCGGRLVRHQLHRERPEIAAAE